MLLGLTNRETAAVIWLMIFVVAILFSRDIRTGVASIVRLLLDHRFLLTFAALLASTVIASWAAWRVGLWTRDLLSDSVVWFVTVALVLYFKANEALATRGFYRRALFASMSTVALLEVFTGFYSLPLIAEFLVQGVLIVAIPLAAIAQTQERTAPFANCVGWLIALVGLTLLGLSVWHFVADVMAGTLDWAWVGRWLALPIWSLLVALPVLWSMSLFMAYEVAFTRLRIAARDGTSTWRTRIAFVVCCGPRTVEVAAADWALFTRMIREPRIRGAMAQYRAWRAERIAAAVPVHPIVADANATRESLEWLSACHMGHYRNGGRYRADLLPIVESQFLKYGLPNDPGIHHEISTNGKAWFAWRTLRDGRVVGIGANAPAPDTWYFEGETAPQGPPSGPGWGDQFAARPEDAFWS